MKYTPGPWRVDGPHDYSPHRISIIGPRGNWNIYCSEPKSGAKRGMSPQWHGWGDEMSDARLIASAPDLLEACKAVSFAIRLGLTTELKPYEKAWGGLLESIDKVIAKATDERSE